MDQDKIVNFGDIIVFETNPGTFLSVDISGNLVWCLAPAELQSPINFEKCLWRVCEKLSYVDQEMKMVQMTRGRSDSIASQLSQRDLDLIDRQAEKEREINLSEIKTASGSNVLYGRVVQFQHVATGKYLSTTNAVANFDRECIALGLISGSSSAYFKVKPKYKVRNEGSPLLHKDDINLESMNSAEYFIHETSKGPPMVSKAGFRFNEANLSRSTIGSSLTIKIYSNYDDSNPEEVPLVTGKAIRLFDREKDSFINASCCPNFNKYNSIFPSAIRGPQGFKPLHQDNFTSKSVWCIEKATRTEGGYIKWNKEEYRLKHLPTQRYLTVCPINMLKTTTTSPGIEPERQYRLTLETDGTDQFEPLVDLSMTSDTITQFVDPEKLRNMLFGSVRETVKIGKVFLKPDTYDLKNLSDLSGLFFGRKKTRFERQTFAFRSLDGATSPYMPGSDVMLTMVHHDIEGRELYYHCNDNGTICMSTVSRTFDALLLNQIDNKQEQFVRFLMEAMPVLKEYTKRINESKFPASKSDLALENRILSQVICSSIMGVSDKPLGSVNPMDANGPPLLGFQNCSRDQYFIDLLIFAVVAPLNMGIKISFGNNGVLDWDDPRFRSMAPTHKLAWKALLSLISGNPLSQIHVKSVLVRMVEFIDRSKEHIICKILKAIGDAGYVLGNKWYNYTLIPTYDLAVYSMEAGYEVSAPAIEYAYKAAARSLDSTLQATYLGIQSGATSSYAAIAAGCDPVPDPSQDQAKDGSKGVDGKEVPPEEGERDPLDDIEIDFDDEPQAGCFSNIDFTQFQLPDFDWPLLAELGFTEERDRRVPVEDPPIPYDEKNNFKPAIEAIVSQVPFPVGAAEVLTTLIGNNRVLLAAYVDEAMIEYFKALIKREGPSARFMQFFRAICSCQEDPIIKNQELCLRELILEPRNPETPTILSPFEYLMIKVSPILEKGSPVMKERKNWRATELPDLFGELVQYMGIESVSQGFQEIAVHWLGDQDWTPAVGALYFSPKSMGLKTVQTEQSKQSVPIEEFCWPLDHQLCSLFNGVDWGEFEEKMTSDPKLKSKFMKHQMLAEYFLSQIETYAEMARGRAYNCIRVLEEMFPFDMLLSLITNNLLPFVFRTVCLRFIRYLWLERYPHENNCGRSCIPTMIWVLDSLRDSSLTDSNHDALPFFKLPENSKLLIQEEFQIPIYNINSPNKFISLNHFCDYVLKNCKRQIADQREKNLMIQELISLITSLLQLGFYPKISDVQNVSVLLMLLLDGRDDIDTVDSTNCEESQPQTRFPQSLHQPDLAVLNRDTIDPFYDQSQPYDYNGVEEFREIPISDVSRYQIDDKSFVIMQTKLKIMNALKIIVNFRNQFRLGKLMTIFQNHLKKNVNEVDDESIDSLVTLLKPDQNSYNSLNLNTICKVNFDGILLDLMQYSDDSLFEAAFNMLSREHEQIVTLLNLARKTLLLPTKLIPIFTTFDNLEETVSELRELLNTIEGWSTHSVQDNFFRCWEILDLLHQFLSVSQSNPQRHQRILLLLDLKTTLLRPFNWDLLSKFEEKEKRAQARQKAEEDERNKGILAQIGIKSSPPEPKGPIELQPPDELDQRLDNLSGLTEHCIDLLIELCQNNPEVRLDMSSFSTDYMSLGIKFPTVYSLVIEIFKGQKLVLSKTPYQLFNIFSKLLVNKDTTRKYAIEFFKSQLIPESQYGTLQVISAQNKVPQNQRLVIQAISDAVRENSFQFDLSVVSDNSSFLDYINMVELLALCSFQNLNICGKLAQSMLAWDHTANNIRKILIGDKALTPEELLKKRKKAKRDALKAKEDLNSPNTSMKYLTISNEDLSLGLELKGLSRGTDGGEIERMISAFIIANLKYIQYLNFDSKGFDEKAIVDPSLIALVETLCQTLVETDFIKTSFLRHEEEAIIEKLTFLKHYVDISKKVPSNPAIPPLQLKVENACLQMNDMILQQENLIESKYPESIILAHADCLFLLRPSAVKKEFRPSENSFRPGNSADEIAFAEQWEKGTQLSLDKGDAKMDAEEITTSFSIFIDSCQKKLKDQINAERMSTLEVFYNSKSFTSPNDPCFKLAMKEKNGLLTPTKSWLFGEKPDENLNLYRSKSRNEISKLQEEERATSIDWKDIVTRFTSYVNSKFDNDGDLNIVNNILELFILYLREGGGGSDFSTRQQELNELGVTALVYKAIGYSNLISVPKSEPNHLFDLSLELAKLLVEGGSMDTLNLIKRTAEKTDFEGMFFQAFKSVTLRYLGWVKETRYDPDSPYDNDQIEAGFEANEMNNSLDFLTLLCANHHEWWQNALRDQRGFNRQNVNLVECVNEILETLVPRRDIFRRIRPAHILTLVKALNLLVTVVQGPSKENQTTLSKLKTFACSFTILTAKKIRKIGKNLLLLKILIIKLLYSCLENRYNTDMEERLVQRLEVSVFDRLHIELSSLLRKNTTEEDEDEEDQMLTSNTEANSKPSKFSMPKFIKSSSQSSLEVRSTFTESSFEAVEEIPQSRIDQALKDLLVVRYRIGRKYTNYTPSTVFDPSEFDIPGLDAKQIETLKKEKQDFIKAMKKFNSTIATIEVQWGNEIEEVIFPLPKEVSFLSTASKLNFMSNVNLESTESRLKELMAAKDDFFDEMEIYLKLKNNTFIFSHLQKNLITVKNIAFGIALMLNFNLILNMSVAVGPTTPYFNGILSPQTSITFLLSILALGVYFLITTYFILPAFPLKIRLLNRMSEVGKSENKESKNWNVFTSFIIALLLSVFFFVMHFFSFNYRYPTMVIITTYGYFIGIIFGIWFIKCLRDFIIYPTNIIEFSLCLILDAFSNSGLILSLIFSGMTILGLFGYSAFYTILLLDYVTINDYAKICVDAVVKPYQSLFAILLVFLIATAIFGVFGVNSFGITEFISQPGGVGADEYGQLNYQPDAYCNSMTSCLGLIFYGGLRASDISTVMSGTGPGSPDFTSRFFFDMAFFIIIGVLLFNMVTGIIVDTFSSLREETVERKETLENESFISGLTREEMNDKGIDFEELVEKRQNPWDYISFAYYLQTKDSELNGVESYVSRCIQEQNFDWFPKKNCIKLQELEGETEVEDPNQARLIEVEKKMTEMEETLKKILSLVNHR